jgi:dipeptidyl aminopeptidase/acylaminoacyl peptidase
MIRRQTVTSSLDARAWNGKPDPGAIASPSLLAFLLFLALLLLPGGPARAPGSAPLFNSPLGAQETVEPGTFPQETASGEAREWTPALSMRYHAVAGTALSPNGELVAYGLRKPLMEGETSEYRTHLWVVPSSGGRPRQYTRGESSAGSPGFSPDGRYLAFTSSRSGESQIWVMPVNGGEARQVTKVETGVGSFRWAPDRSALGFTMRDPKTEEEEAAEEEKRDVILVDQDFKFSHLYRVPFSFHDTEIPEAERLTEGEFHVTAFHWSPDGTRIVFAHQPDPRLNTNFMAGDLSVVEVASGIVTPLVTGAGVESSPLVSPDGRWVAYTSSGARPEPVGLADVYVVPLEGGESRKLAETHDRDPSLLAWSGDGSRIYVQEPVGTTTQVQALPLDGGPVERVTSGEGVFGSVSMNADATLMAFTFQTPEEPWDVYVSSVRDFSMERLTDLHAHVPRPPMGRTELLSWESKDGRFRVEGLLTYPVGYEEGDPYPLILNVHGGPGGVYTQGFTGGPSIYMIQYFAQQGYAVLRPNPRGSRGYGKEFRYANVRDWGFGDMDDLMAGVERVVAMGVAHPDSLALMGWSYGGYMTSFAVTRTDRFKAASMGAGLPNLVSMTTTTDIQDYLVAHMGGVEFWEDYEAYQRHSAIYRIARVTTPTQVIHGAEDLRVPFTQGQEFYRALKRRGVPTEMVVLPRTPHGPREPKLLMEVSEHILRWFDTHLGRR